MPDLCGATCSAWSKFIRVVEVIKINGNVVLGGVLKSRRDRAPRGILKIPIIESQQRDLQGEKLQTVRLQCWHSRSPG